VAGSKIRVYELSKKLGVANKDLMTLLEKEFGLELKSHSSSIDSDVAKKAESILKGKGSTSSLPPSQPPAAMETQPAKNVKSAPTPNSVPVENLPPTIHSINVIRRAKPPEPKPPEEKPEEQKVEAAPSPVVETPAQPVNRAEPLAPSPVTAPEPMRPKVIKPAPQASQPEKTEEKKPEPPAARPAPDAGRPDMRRPAASDRPSSSRPFTPGSESHPSHPHRTATAVQENRPTSTFPDKRRPPQQPAIAASAKPSAPHRPGKPEPKVVERPLPQQPKRDKNQARQPEPVVEEDLPKIVSITEPLTVSELAQKLRLRETEIIKHLFMKGAMVTVNQTLDLNYAKSIAQEFEFELEESELPAQNKEEYNPSMTEKKEKLDKAKYKHLQKRSPVVSIMGHVDHGKTSLLDAIRETRHKIVDTEAGGITQSIGAYSVEKNDQKIVFLDTPGHEAFTSMRMRGAKATDIAILVVAADDGVMPQTIEAINHAKAAAIPIIVAVNKIDKPDADPEKVLVQLSDHGLVSEKWGGDTVTVEVSALEKLGLDDLLEMILLVSELLDLKADATVAAEGVIIEAQLDKRKGPVATALVQNGLMKVGDNILIGPVGGRVRALISDTGERVDQAGPSTPVEILGLSEVPKAGDHFQVLREEKKFKQMLNDEKLKDREQRLGNRMISSGFNPMATRSDTGEAAEQQEFHVIIKADTQGSAEAVVGALTQLSTDEIKVKILHTGTGDISEADVMLASASQALIIGFNVKEDANAQRVSEQAGVPIHKYDVIYHINEEMEKLMLGKLSPDTQEIESGQAEVRQLFTVGKNVVIAGCMVTKGKIVRNAKAKVTRGGKEMHTGPLDNLKRFREDAREVASGYECGISFNKFNDLQIGDVITVYTVEETERTSL
jgi:translation initiation factor IF-2